MKRYEEIRDRIRTGDMLFFEGGLDYLDQASDRQGFFSRVIKRWTMSSVSHVGMAWRVDLPKGNYRILIIHSIEPNGVCAQPLSTMGHFKWLPVRTTKLQGDRMVASFWTHWNRLKYSWWGISVQILKPFVGQTFASRLSREASICSRYVAWHRRRHCGEAVDPAPSPGELERWAELNIVDEARGEGSLRIVNPPLERELLNPVKLSPAIPG